MPACEETLLHKVDDSTADDGDADGDDGQAAREEAPGGPPRLGAPSRACREKARFEAYFGVFSNSRGCPSLESTCSLGGYLDLALTATHDIPASFREWRHDLHTT